MAAIIATRREDIGPPAGTDVGEEPAVIRLMKLGAAMAVLAGVSLWAAPSLAHNPMELRQLLSIAACDSCELRGVDLSGADLVGATITNSDLTYANLFDANLTDANLAGSTLAKADLTSADLTGADLTNADLSDTIFCSTTMPDGGINNSGC